MMRCGTLVQDGSSRIVLRHGRRLAMSALGLLLGLGWGLLASTGVVAEQPQDAQSRTLSDEELNTVNTQLSTWPANTITETAWAIELTPRERGSSQDFLDDTLIFADGLMRSRRSTTQGYQPAVYSLDMGTGGELVWESAQHHPDGTAILWQGELQGDHMTGTFSKQLENGSFQIATFVGTRAMLPGAPRYVSKLPGAAGVSAARAAVAPVQPQTAPREADTAAAERLAATERQLADAKAGIARMESAYRDAQVELTKTREQLRARTLERDATLDEKTRTATQAAARERELADAQAHLKQSEASLQTRTQEQRARQQLEGDLTQANAKLKELEQAASRLTELQTTLKTEQESRRKVETALTDQQNTQRQQAIELQQARTQVQERETAIQERTAKDKTALENTQQAQQRLEDELARIRAQLQTQTGHAQAPTAANQQQDQELARARQQISNLQKSLHVQTVDANTEQQRLKTSLAGAQQTLASARADLTAKEQTLAQREHALADSRAQADKQMGELKNQLQRLADERNAAQGAQQHVGQSQTAQAKAFAQLQDDHAKLQANFKTTEWHAQHLETEISKFRSQIKELQASLQPRSDERDAAQAARQKTQQAYDALVNERAQTQTAQQQQLEAKLAKAEAQMTVLKTNLETRIKERETTQTSLTTTQADLDRAVKQERDARQELEQHLAKVREQLKTAATTLEGRTAERDTARADKTEMAVRDAKLARELAEAREQAATLKTKLEAGLKERDATLAQRTERDRTATQEHGRARQQLETQLSQAREQLKTLEQTVSRNTHLQQELASLNATLRTEQDARHKSEASLKTQQEVQRTQEIELKQTRARAEELGHTQQDRTAKAGAQREEAQKAQQQRDAELAKAKEEISSLKTQLAAYLKERDAAQSAQARLQKDLARTQESLRDRDHVLAQREQEVAQLRTERDQSVARLHTVETRHQPHEQELARAQQQIQELQTTLRTRTADADAQRRRIEGSLKDAQQVRDALKTQIMHVQQQLAFLSAERDETHSAQAQHTHDQVQLEQELATARAALEVKEQALAQHERTLTDNRAQAVQQVSDLQMVVHTQQDAHRDRQAELEQTRVQLHQLYRSDQDEFAKYKATIAAAKEDRQRLESLLGQLRTELQDQQRLTQELADARRSAAQTEQHIAVVQHERDDLKVASLRLEDQMRRLQETSAQAQRDAKAHADEMEQALARLRAQLQDEQQRQANTAATTREDTLQDQRRLHGEIAQLETAVRTQQDALAQHRAALDALRAQFQQLQAAPQPAVTQPAPAPQPPEKLTIQAHERLKRSPKFEKQREAAIDEYVRRQRRALLMEMELRRLINAQGVVTPPQPPRAK